jgi:hypothetical protein
VEECVSVWTSEIAKYKNTEILRNYLHLPHAYNIHNSVHLATDLSMEISEDMRMCSFDIENMYTTIPISDVINIINNLLKITLKLSKLGRKK